MTTAIESPPVGCCEPALGAQARQALGCPLAARLTEHVARCLACQLELRAFERFVRESASESSTSSDDT